MLVGCAVALLSFALAGPASAANLVTNPGFESGDLTGWLVFGQSPSSNVTVQSGDNGPSAPGTYYAFMNNQAEAVGLVLKQSTPEGSAGPGTVFYSFDLKLDQSDLGGVLFVEMFAEQAGGGVIGGSGLLGPLFPWQWTNYANSFEAPAGTSFLTIQFVAATGATVGSTCLVRVDNVSLDQGTTATEAASWGGIKSLYR
jgi:hypothetical protein